MRVLFFDTESTDLNASWGRILCASFVELTHGRVYTFRADEGSDEYYKNSDPRTIYLPGKELVDDGRLVEAIRDELEYADIIVSWNGILHDIPLLNARLQLAGHRPYKGKQWPKGSHLDLMYYATGQALKIGSKKLDNVAKYFGLPHQKTPLDGVTWQRAAAGDVTAMDLVVQHCEFDTLVLADVFPYLAPHIKKLQLPFANWYEFASEIEL